jgi:hypothetical protein
LQTDFERESGLTLRLRFSDPGPPGNFRYSFLVPDVTGKHKQMVAKPVQVFDHQRVYYKSVFAEMHTGPLGTAANTTADMGCGNCGVTAGKDEKFHFRQTFVHPVDFLLQPFHIPIL